MVTPISDIITEEGWHTLADGDRLYTKTWKTAEQPKARVVFVHGFSDHCNAYNDFFPTLASHGIEVFGFDQRGWGRSVKSPREKGLTGPTSLVLSDISSILSRFIPSSTSQTTPSSTTSPADPPLFLFGHSMGGQEVLTHASLFPNPQIRGYLVESPFIAFSPATKPSRLLVAAGRLGARFLPHFQMVNHLDPALISRDPAVQQTAIADALRHDTGTLEGLAGMIARAESLEAGRVRVTEARSVWCSHGTADGICDFGKCKEWVERDCVVKDKTFKAYEGWYHMLHAEPGDCPQEFAKDVVDWISARLGPA